MPPVVLFPPRRAGNHPPPGESSPPLQFSPLPPDRWPAWARQLAARRHPGDRSVLDIIEREHGPTGSDPFKLWHAETFGVWASPCNCRAFARRLASQFRLPADSGPALTSPI